MIKCSERIQEWCEIYVACYFICRLTKSDFPFGAKIAGSKYASGFQEGWGDNDLANSFSLVLLDCAILCLKVI